MKKGVLLLTLLMFSLSLVSAAEIQVLGEDLSFDHGETLVAKISGNFISDLTSENVFFYRNGNIPVSFEYEIAEIDNEFYLYALLERKSGAVNYTLSIENTEYMDGTETSNENLVKDFTITSQTASFSLKPGFVVFPNDFSLQIQNLQSNTITVQINTPESIDSQSQVNVLSGEIKTIDFTLSDVDSDYEEITLSSGNTSYTVPIFLNLSTKDSSDEGSDSPTSSNDDIDFDFSPDRITVKMALDSKATRVVYLVNRGNSEIEDLEFFVSEEIRSYVEIDSNKNSIDEDSNARIEITIESPNEEDIVEGEIRVESGNESTTLELVLEFQEGYIAAVEEEESINEQTITTCVELEGSICGSDFKCSGEVSEVRDGICCLATCEAKSNNSLGKTIGWTMIAVVLLFALWFFKRYKRVRPKVDLLNPGRR